MRNAETKENTQRRPNNDNVVTEHSQGPLCSFSRAIDNILSHILRTILELLKRQVEEVNYMMTKLYP